MSVLQSILGRFRPRTNTTDWPDRLRHYASQSFASVRDHDLSDVRFVVFDTETTGLEVRTDRLLSIAGVVVHSGQIHLDETFETMVEQGHVGSDTAVSVHGLITSDLAGAAAEDEAIANFLAFAGPAPLVAHHAVFDISMLQAGIAKHRGARVRNCWLDTAEIAIRLEQGPISVHPTDRRLYALDAVLERYDIDVEDRHTAAGDALATAQLLLVLLKRANARGLRRLRDLRPNGRVPLHKS